MLGLFDSATGAAIAEHGGHDPEVRAAGAVGRPNGGVADSLAEAKAAFRAAASAFARKSGREMLNLSISVDDPLLTWAVCFCCDAQRCSVVASRRSTPFWAPLVI